MNTESVALFNLEPATFLENLKRKLQLKKDWKRGERTAKGTCYDNGSYYLRLQTDSKTNKLAEITALTSEVDAKSIKDSVAAMLILAHTVMAEIDDAFEPNEFNEILGEIIDLEPMTEPKTKIVRGIFLSAQKIKDLGVYVSFVRISGNDQIKLLAHSAFLGL